MGFFRKMPHIILVISDACMYVVHIFFFLCQQLSVYSKNGKVQKRGKINLVGRLQLSTEKSQEEDNEGIMQLRILRVQVS